MADIAEDSLLDIEDSAEVVKLNGVVHDKEESKVVKQCVFDKHIILHCEPQSLNRQTDGKTSVTDLKNFKVLTVFTLANVLGSKI